MTRGIAAGPGTDPYIFMWFFAWWPYVITHHLDPLFTDLVWQPAGIWLGWVTSVPLLALLGWPLTLISPVLTFNVFIVLGPVLAAFTAYLLCLYVTGRPAAAVIGGYLFGYSSYETGQDSVVLNLSFTMFVPLLLLIVLRRLDDRLTRRGVILLATLALVCQFLISIEVFAIMFVFGGVLYALSMFYLPERRPVLRRLVVDALLTGLPVSILLSPFLISMALHAHTVALPWVWPYYFTTDLLNFVVPTRLNLFGGPFAFIAARFNGGIQEQDAYLGLPLLLIIVLFVREQASLPSRRLVFVMFLLLAVFSLGPQLMIAGHYERVALPWALFMHLPLLPGALPERFQLFVSLGAAVIAALWIAFPAPGKDRWRLALGMAACIFLLPAWHGWRPIPFSRFFQPSRAEVFLGENARVLVLPFGINGPSSFWQAENRFGFRQTGGYLGYPPRSMQLFPVESQLFGNIETPHFTADLGNFCAATRTQFIVAGPGTSAVLQAQIARLHWPARTIDDVTIYAAPGAGKLPNE